jgi:diacylglycerol kinase (ATP)
MVLHEQKPPRQQGDQQQQPDEQPPEQHKMETRDNNHHQLQQAGEQEQKQKHRDKQPPLRDDAPSMIAFVNPGSGSNDGAKVFDVLRDALGPERVFNIKEDGGPEPGLARWASNRDEDVRVLVAGGDGTFSWVATAVDKEHYDNVRLVVIPLGSGNDMSRALGWGRKFPGAGRVLQWLEWAKTAPAHSLDVWRLEAEEATPDATAAAAAVASSASPLGTTDDDEVSHGARPLVCNYLSLGADALVELRFNQLRWAAPERYTSRLGNFKAHVVVGTKYMMSGKPIRIVDHVESLIVDEKVIALPKSLQALIFLNIPSYGAGTQPWGLPKSPRSGAPRPMVVNDGKFEVIGLKSLNQYGLIKVLHTHGVRICQGSRMELKLKAPRTPFQVDGEPWEQRGGVVRMHAGNSIGVLQGPVYCHGSRRHASFDGKCDSAYIRHDDRASEYGRDQIPRRRQDYSNGVAIDHARPTSSFG